MVGFISSDPVETAPYVQALKYQAKRGNHAPHPDGWGYCVYTGDGCTFRKSIRAAFEDDDTGPRVALTALYHARQASDSGTVTPQNAHPFVFQQSGKLWSFVHNGTIVKTPAAWGEEIDSKIYANLLEQQMKEESSASEALQSVVEMIQSQAEADSLNALFATDDELVAMRCSDERHTLFYRSSPALLEVSTEPLAIPWREVPIGTMLDARHVGNEIVVQTIVLHHMVKRDVL
jgi:predicted glutamine amidotransferase